jgi:hypothetical protein
MQTIKGTVAGLVALVTCPCHLPLTLPVLLTLTAGTAVGIWLAAHQWFIWLGSAVLFVGGLALMMFWMKQAQSSLHCEVPAKQSDPTQHRPHQAGNPVTNQTKMLVQSKETSRV